MKQSHIVILLLAIGLNLACGKGFSAEVNQENSSGSEPKPPLISDPTNLEPEVAREEGIEPEEALTDCYSKQVESSDGERTVASVEAFCRQLLADSELKQQEEISALKQKLIDERAARDNPNVITPHKRNYLLPVSYATNPNGSAFQDGSGEVPIDNFETKFQLSFKAPIVENILQEDDVLFFGFTIQSYWQMYNSEISSPFRETNYQPEIFYGMMNDFTLGEWTNLVNIIGIEHQSNGRTQPLSRSWNRLYAQIVWENDDWVFMFKPWYRLPEGDKTEVNQADGDDNPDIYKYMGYFEFSGAYQWDDQTFAVMFRNNLDSSRNRGAIQFDWTFPMGKRFKGYAQFFSGYGESLIDYNRSSTRLGFGVALTDVF